MSLRELYQEMIVDHSKRPRNFRKIDQPTFTKEGFNPLCGDKLTVYVMKDAHDTLADIAFEACGCAISVASASLMTEALKGKTLTEAETIFHDFHQLATQGANEKLASKLGKLAVLAGVFEYPARVKCATLAWHTLRAAIKQDSTVVTTE